MSHRSVSLTLIKFPWTAWLLACILYTPSVHASNSGGDNVGDVDNGINLASESTEVHTDDNNSVTEGTGVSRAGAEDVAFVIWADRRYLDFPRSIVIGDPNSVRSSGFVIGAKVVIITHGFHNKYDEKDRLVDYLKNAYLKRGFVNIIATDWSKLSYYGTFLPIAFLNYPSVEQNAAPTTGKQICRLIMFLTRQQFIRGPEDVHLIGHSLGAHINGIAGNCVTEMSRRLVGRITGLDPSFPLSLAKENTLNAGQAAFVDVLHTDDNRLGAAFGSQLGTVDFYANGGSGANQPLCNNFTLNPSNFIDNNIEGQCSHARAYQYYARSILRTQPDLCGCACMSSSNFVLATQCVSPKRKCNDPVLFGEYVPTTAAGKYYMQVNDDLPGLGAEPSSFPEGNGNGGGGQPSCQGSAFKNRP